MKKFFIITSVLFGIFLLFFLIYNFLFKNNPLSGSVPGAVVVSKEKSEEPKKEAMNGKKIAPFTSGEGVAPYFDAQESALFYLVPDEQALKETYLVTNAPRTVTTFSFTPKNIIWSPDGSRALVKKSDTEWALFTRSGETKNDTPVQMLKPGIESPAWTSLGERIVYKYFDASTGLRTLNIANPDGAEWQEIGQTDIQFLEMKAIPKSSMIAFWNWGNAFEKTSLKTIPAIGGEVREIFSSNYGADYSLSPNGLNFLLSGVVEKGGSPLSLSTINAQGGGYQNLSIPTLVGKTVWSKNSRMIYYALPGALPAGSILPNDYYRKPIRTTDTFWKVDMDTNQKSRIVDPGDIDRSYDAENLVLDTDETTLFFRNRHDGKIYRIIL